MNFNPFPIKISKRLFLRSICASDAETILYLQSNQKVNQFIKRPEHRQTKSTEDALSFIEKQHKNIENNVSIVWGITLKNKPQLIGTICLWNFSKNRDIAEVGYDLNPEYHNKGIMSEALNMIIDYGFKELKLHKIEAFTDFKNESSKRLLTKNGFQLNALRKDIDNTSNLIFEIKNVKASI